ncbi:MAG: dihydrofolate synthase/folylpolyglutamate synthase [Bradymonadia bacterium]|jgi:dihydrofolate synthase/folylpolyglutamate synthase
MSDAGVSNTQREFECIVQALFRQNQFAIKYDIEAMHAAVSSDGVSRVAQRMCLVGGTNGKGTTSAALAALATAAGLRVGLYTSPHLIDVRERMRVCGEPIARDVFVRIAAGVLDEYSGQEHPHRGERALSYFELTTLIALRWFGECSLDLAVFEVGLGGRLDATNVLDPDVSVVTSIALDHTAWLGESLELIAGEKLGIARRGRPLLLHRDSGGFDALLAAGAAASGCVEVVEGGADPEGWCWALAQAASARLGIAAENAEEARARMRWPGRRDVRTTRDGNWRWLDGAHNVAATNSSSEWLASEWRNEPAPIVLGLSPDRSARVLAAYAPLASELHVVCSSSGRGTDVVSLRADIERERASGVPWPLSITVHETPAAAMFALRSEPRVAVLGSLYVVGDALAWLGETAESLVLWADGPLGLLS